MLARYRTAGDNGKHAGDQALLSVDLFFERERQDHQGEQRREEVGREWGDVMVHWRGC